jgi:hypothetical protein
LEVQLLLDQVDQDLVTILSVPQLLQLDQQDRRDRFPQECVRRVQVVKDLQDLQCEDQVVDHALKVVLPVPVVPLVQEALPEQEDQEVRAQVVVVLPVPVEEQVADQVVLVVPQPAPRQQVEVQAQVAVDAVMPLVHLENKAVLLSVAQSQSAKSVKSLINLWKLRS